MRCRCAECRTSFSSSKRSAQQSQSLFKALFGKSRRLRQGVQTWDLESTLTPWRPHGYPVFFSAKKYVNPQKQENTRSTDQDRTEFEKKYEENKKHSTKCLKQQIYNIRDGRHVEMQAKHKKRSRSIRGFTLCDSYYYPPKLVV